MRLSDLKTNEKAIITKVRGRGAFRKRIIEMGFIKGKEISFIKDAPLKDPAVYEIMSYEISLRRSEANLIEVITKKEAEKLQNNFEGTITDNILKVSAKKKSKIINVALVGNPNCGKTTIFNFASKSKEHVGNYSGVTVQSKKSKFKKNDYIFNITDLPGTYSLTAYSPEELYVRKYIFDEVPDIIINIVSASNLERNLYLTTQLIDMDVKVIIALNMFDELKKKGDKLNYKELGKMIGIPIIPTVASKGKGIENLFDKAIEVYEDKDLDVRHIHINYGRFLEKSIKKIQKKIKIKNNYFLTDKISSRFLAIKSLEKDEEVKDILQDLKNYKSIKNITNKEINCLEKEFSEDTETLITDAKFGFISGALGENLVEGRKKKYKKTKIIDAFVTHKLFGIPIFIFFLWLMFYSTFELGSYAMNGIQNLVDFVADLFGTYMENGVLKDLIIDGIIGGVGGVIVFLPNILILFFFISLMEDTGYMSRAAFIMDKLMHKIGLHGKSFIPLIMGFGCNVPAIMATRTLENKNDRFLTILINPFISCSARLPVYILFISAFFPKNQTIMLFGIYLIGIFFSVISAIFLKKIFFQKDEAPFVMELPPYRIPTLKNTISNMWGKGQEYLKKMGGVILVASIIIWFLNYYPKNVEYSKNYDIEIKKIESFHEKNNSKITKIDSIKIIKLKIEKASEKQEKSYIGKIGKFIEPVMKPLGLDWKASVSLLVGVAGKEIVISTLGVLYQEKSDEENTKSLINKLQKEVYQKGENKGKKVFNPIIAFSFLLFILIYFPCIAVIAAVKKETNSWKWAFFMIFYTTSLAWITSFAFFQIASLF